MPEMYHARLQTWLDHICHCCVKLASLPPPQDKNYLARHACFLSASYLSRAETSRRNAHNVWGLECSWRPHLSVAGAEAKGKAHGCPDKCAKDNQDYSVDHVAQYAHKGDTNCLHSKSTQTGIQWIRDAHLHKATAGSTMCERTQRQVLYWL